MKRCSGCGREFTRAQWDELEYVGPMDDGFEGLELRNCPDCDSTIAIVLYTNDPESCVTFPVVDPAETIVS